MSTASSSGGKWVAVVGSSGGSAVLMSSPWEIVTALREQLKGINDKIPPRIGAAQVVCCENALDRAGPHSMAALWIMDAKRPGYELEPQCVLRGELRMVNARARELDGRLAQGGIMDTMDAVVALSADARPGGANEQVLRAAARRGLPIAGTGGSSLSRAASAYGCRLAGNAGGSVAVNVSTKAISVASSLASFWNLSYSPRRLSSPPPLQTIIADFAPALIALALTRRCLEIFLMLSFGSFGYRTKPDMSNGSLNFNQGRKKHYQRGHILPLSSSWSMSDLTREIYAHDCKEEHQSSTSLTSITLLFEFVATGLVAAPAVGALAAGRRSELGSLAYAGGALIGGLCHGSSCVAVFLAGVLYPELAPRCLALCARQAIPATASTLLVAGCLPMALAVGSRLLALDIITLYATSFMRYIISTVTASSILAALSALVMSYGCREKGWYHAYFLPLIVLEHEYAQLSTLGALDCLCLCITGAGANAAQIILPRCTKTSIGSASFVTKKGERMNISSNERSNIAASFLTKTVNDAQNQVNTVRTKPRSFSSSNKKDFTWRQTNWLSPPDPHDDHMHADDPHSLSSATASPSLGEQRGTDGARPWSAPEQRTTADLARLELARRGFAINICCGDYVEACHPFLLVDPALDLATYFACALAAALCAGARSSAYVPLPVSILIADQPIRFAQAALIAFFLPCIAGLISNAIWNHCHRSD